MKQSKLKLWDLRPLSHPLFWVALCALVINDRCLKGHAPSWLTGKLSDVAFLVVAPCVLAGLLPKAWVWARCAAFAFPFLVIAGVNLCPSLSEAFVAAAGLFGLHWRLWPDVADLVALLVLPLAARILWAPTHIKAQRPSLQASGVILGTWACVATSAPPMYEANTLLANRSGQSITVRLSALNNPSSCTDISREAAKLTLGDLSAPRTYTLAPGELLEITSDKGKPPEGLYTCNGPQHYYECDLLYVEVDGLPGALVAGQTWNYDSFDDTCDRRLKPSDKALRGYLEIVGNVGAIAWRPGEELAVATLERVALQARPVSPESCKAIAGSYIDAVQRSTVTCDVDADCVGVIGFATADQPNCGVYFNKDSVAAAEAGTLTNAWASKGCFGATACVPPAPAACINGKCRAGCTDQQPPLTACPPGIPATPSTAAPHCPVTCYSPPSHPLQPPAPLPAFELPDASPPPDACPYMGVASSFCPR